MTEHPADPDVGGLALQHKPPVPGGGDAPVPGLPAEPTELIYAAGLEVQARSQWWYARHRFLRHRLAMASLVLLILIFGAGIFAGQLAPHDYKAISADIVAAPSAHHWFGTDQAGRDSFSRTLFGIRTSAEVAAIVAIIGTIIGVIFGAISGYYAGWLDNLMMRITDLFLILPPLAILLTVSKFMGHGSPTRVAIILGLLLWPNIARIVRGSFLSLKEKEYIEAAKASGSGDLRIMFRHILPNTVGPIVVSATLLTGAAILYESVLSFLGFGVQEPHAALGKLINDGESAGLNVWWLVTFPGLVIVIIILCVNFIGDGLRDALDPTQRRIRA